MAINEEGRKRETRWTFSDSCFGNVKFYHNYLINTTITLLRLPFVDAIA